jgi:predicted TIM-barrel fold metal-dependent hydrolase
MRTPLTALLLLLSGAAPAAELPIIDMHLHALRVDEFVPLGGPPPIPHCVPMTDYPVPGPGRRWAEIVRSRDLPCRAIWSPASDREVMERTVAIMKRRNVFAVVSGALWDSYAQAAPGRVIPSLSLPGGPQTPALAAVRESLQAGRFAVLGEVTAQYAGTAPDDPSLVSYWALAEELDVPVGIHIGTGPVGAPYLGFERYRARLHSPLALEEVLIRHPKLRVYIMHAAWPMLDELLAMLWTHPQLYVDVGAIDWALPREEFHHYLQRIVEAGFGRRVLFGSDQMIWPEALELAIESIETAAFLSAEEKRDIFFDNAVRFLRLGPEQVAFMHGKAGD